MGLISLTHGATRARLRRAELCQNHCKRIVSFQTMLCTEDKTRGCHQTRQYYWIRSKLSCGYCIISRILANPRKEVKTFDGLQETQNTL